MVQLAQAGLEPVMELPVEQQEPVLLLYDTPHQLLATTDLEGSALVNGYESLLAAPASSPRLAMWRLSALDAEQLGQILSGNPPPELSSDLPPPEPEPLAALVTVALCRSVPGLLDAYLDLELQAELGGGEPDSAYFRRLQNRISSEGLLKAWRSPGDLAQQAADLREQLIQSNGLLEENHKALAEANKKIEQQDNSLKEAREASEISLLQLHQRVEEERELHTIAVVEKQRQLEAGFRDLEELRRTKAAQESSHEQELEALRLHLEPQLAELEQRLASKETELRELREAAALSLQQLYQVQEELERYFLANLEKQRHLESVVRDLEELRQSKTAMESAHELAQAAQQRVHEHELEALRQQLEPHLAELEQSLASRDTELREAREAAELTLQQLHQQVQEERELLSLADLEKQRHLESVVRDLEELRQSKTAMESAHELAQAAQQRVHEQELEALRQQLEPHLAELEQSLASRDTELREAREAAELTLQQIHQVQEELEHSFLKTRASEQLAQAQMEQLQRAQGLMTRLNPDVLPIGPFPPALAVEVLPEVAAAMPEPSLQIQSLLSTYAASLQRASALLERARRY